MLKQLCLLVAGFRSLALVTAIAASCVAANAEDISTGDSWRETALRTVLDEPSVVEAMFPNDSRSSFWASMRDDGSRRDGFAEYLCLTLFDAGMPKGEFLVIRIWDAGAMARGDMEEIGRFECSRK